MWRYKYNYQSKFQEFKQCLKWEAGGYLLMKYVYTLVVNNDIFFDILPDLKEGDS